MVDITHKTSTLRKAIASAKVVVSKPETISAIENRQVPKGDIFEFARASALFAIKKTSDVIPDCHPLPVEFASITYKIEGLAVVISVEVHTIYKTGVEVEAMHGASVAALVMYDMLKPIDKGVTIEQIKLVEKTGGKSDAKYPTDLKCAVIVCSDSVSKGEKEESSGKKIVEILSENGLQECEYEVVSDDIISIQSALEKFLEAKMDLIVLTGGTGLSHRDVTPEAVLTYIDKPIPGIMETARAYGQQRIRTAMLSRGIAGFSGDSLIVTLPGSKKGVEESLQAIFPQVLHVFSVRDNSPH
ncbi:bifunctional molybdenum cofactor biosynthesis protein MoaC/MoaB [Flavobacterium sp.]|uniref:bifunctional molybdenum cofactor biosynthesis protein MoaC/MoaB n=1 Tax=Flavobacterium sp. TaxID=239 RepID=UPI0025C50895|nr:bifunctional molybdenum cofactor biosynthesis protein MoaC/MoaB [Flavobacterium sp.]